MTMIVGYAPDERGKAALHLATMLSRSSGEELVVCVVVPAPWLPGMARVDAEYREYLEKTAEQALDLARSYLPPDVTATFTRHSARSAPAGLLEVAEQYDASMVVLGSSSAGAFGRIVLGSVTDRLVHSAPLPIALATRGFRIRPETKVRRLTAAYGGSASAQSLVLAAAAIAAKFGAAIRIASFAVWSRPPYTTRLGTDSEDLVLQEWIAELTQAMQDAVGRVRERTDEVPEVVETVIGQGESWPDAIEDIGWDEGDVMVVGSSELGPVAKVFLGSRATRILRHSPVPVVVVPRGAAEDLADQE
ncbi:MAG TPA: universal stress protein [Kribbellaceae bacterium]|nr:universal stress protein [Kribbellaceae bacterium]